jgi:hypothetical protein
MKTKLKTKILDVSLLDESTIETMYSVFELYYTDTSAEQFRKDLFEKTHVFLCYSKKELVGFSTIFRKKIPAIGPGLFLFSGDTVLKEKYWGTHVLQKTFIRYAIQCKLASPFGPVYWMLISKGFKTYLMMRRYCHFSFPRHDQITPDGIQTIMDKFYSWKFGNAYNSRTGLITFEKSLGAVKGTFADPKPTDLKIPKNKDIDYFLKKNPNYKKGVELACIARIDFKDLIIQTKRLFF